MPNSENYLLTFLIMKKQYLVVLLGVSMILTSCSGESKTSEQAKKKTPSINVVGIIQSQDTNRCSELKDAVKIANCKNGIYLEKATINNDPAQCDNITNTGAVERCKTQTYLNLALSSANPELCAKIPGKKEYIVNCKNQIILNQAFALKDVKICDAIEGADADKTSCRDNVKLQIALNNSDNELCKEIKTKAIQMQCEQSVSSKAPAPSPEIPVKK